MSKKPEFEKPDFNELRNVLAFDEAMGKLEEAGLADAFVAAIEKDPELQNALKRMAPRTSAVRADWSCCVTVSRTTGPNCW